MISPSSKILVVGLSVQGRIFLRWCDEKNELGSLATVLTPGKENDSYLCREKWAALSFVSLSTVL